MMLDDEDNWQLFKLEGGIDLCHRIIKSVGHAFLFVLVASITNNQLPPR
jgi:hypothetical protein